MEPLSEALVSLHRLTVDHPGLGAKLIRWYGSASAVLAEFDPRLTPLAPAVAEKISRSSRNSDHLAGVKKDLNWMEGEQRWIVTAIDDHYPPRLAELDDAPLLLFGEGNPETISTDQIAIVGSRRATENGVKTAETLGEQLAACGFAITSGLALGIDAAAHRGALKVGGATVAVQGIGAGEIYPRRHMRLAMDITQSGCLVSEYPVGTPAFPRNFPSRNRIVTGLSRGTLVVEAQIGSGSLISARLAMEQGREVFAVPGSILAKQSEGCHALIRQGAKLAANVADIVEEFPEFEVKRHRKARKFSVDEAKIIDELARSPCQADVLHEATGIEVPQLMALLIHLEIQGEIESGAMGYRLLDLDVKSHQ